MHRETTAYIRTPSEVRLVELAAAGGVSLHEVKLKWGYIAHRMVAKGETEQLPAFSEALLYCDMQAGHVRSFEPYLSSSWIGCDMNKREWLNLNLC